MGSYTVEAQGMTLEKAVVRLGRQASSPGVAFVALSRVRHPDHLMLEDTFPDMATIMRQNEKESFAARQRWERKMRVFFSRTVREHMRDTSLFTPEKTWTEEECTVADLLLRYLRKKPDLSSEELLDQASKYLRLRILERALVRRVGQNVAE